MADIGPLNIFSAGIPTSAEEVTDNFYDPISGVPVSFEAVNGLLTEANVPSGTTFIKSEMVRQNSMCRAEMTGLTGNLDYHQMLFALSESDPDSYLPIPGASKTFHLPIAPSLTIITWQVTLGNSMTYKEQFDGKEIKLKLFLDGTALAPQTREMPACCDVHASYSDKNSNVLGGEGETIPPYRQDMIRYTHRDRTWSGHAVRIAAAGDGLAAGWHTAHLGLFTNKSLTRIRVRNLKIIWFK